MKKYFTLLILLLVCQVGYSQSYTVNELFNEFSRTSSEKVKLGGIAMGFAGLFTKTMGVNGIEVYDFDECHQDVKERLAQAVRNLKDTRFEAMVNANEDGERTKVLIRIDGDYIREMVVVTIGNFHALVRIKGKIKPSDFEKVATTHGKSGS